MPNVSQDKPCTFERKDAFDGMTGLISDQVYLHFPTYLRNWLSAVATVTLKRAVPK